MNPAQETDFQQTINRRPVSRFQWGIFALCAACLILDGFDVQSIGYVAPALIRDWHIAGSALGPVFSAALVGVLLGSLGCGTIADRVGRRPVLIAGTFAFAALTLLTARVTSISELLIIRFLAGIGLGGIMPSAMALVGEYAPQTRRITAMMAVSCGFTAGAAIGGFIAAWLIPAFGWRSVFIFGGTVPLVIAVLMIFWLPESLSFLAARPGNDRQIAGLLRRIDPAADFHPETRFAAPEHTPAGLPAIHLFREGRTRTTLLLWLVNFMNLLNLYFLSNWIPTLAKNVGFSTATAVLAGATIQLGGTLGTFGGAWLINRLGFIRVLAATFVTGSLAVAAIGLPQLSIPLFFAAAFTAGWCIPGGQPAVNALAAQYYPTYLRSTGIGWGLGIGRLGAIAGPLVGGLLITRNWTMRDMFLLASLPAVVSAVAVLGLSRRNVRQQ